MKTREIEHDRWQPFFSDFTQLHQGKRVHVETLGGGFGARSELHDQPLVGIVVVNTETPDEESIEVVAAADPKQRTDHCIDHASRVRVAEEEDGACVALEIESADGTVTMIRFEPPREGFPIGYRIS
ncbi:MAG TPA: DUF5335 family protein [Tepidisphaeraceae bacterium]|jgi:hypothetical protein|nr:DUF5335 family protein [Tepidisphaeraceae bacterium]